MEWDRQTTNINFINLDFHNFIWCYKIILKWVVSMMTNQMLNDTNHLNYCLWQPPTWNLSNTHLMMWLGVFTSLLDSVISWQLIGQLKPFSTIHWMKLSPNLSHNAIIPFKMFICPTNDMQHYSQNGFIRRCHRGWCHSYP